MFILGILMLALTFHYGGSLVWELEELNTYTLFEVPQNTAITSLLVITVLLSYLWQWRRADFSLRGLKDFDLFRPFRMSKERYYSRCMCKAWPTLVANDCHIHNESPSHFPPFGTDGGSVCDCVI